MKYIVIIIQMKVRSLKCSNYYNFDICNFFKYLKAIQQDKWIIICCKIGSERHWSGLLHPWGRQYGRYCDFGLSDQTSFWNISLEIARHKIHTSRHRSSRLWTRAVFRISTYMDVHHWPSRDRTTVQQHLLQAPRTWSLWQLGSRWTHSICCSMLRIVSHMLSLLWKWKCLSSEKVAGKRTGSRLVGMSFPLSTNICHRNRRCRVDLHMFCLNIYTDDRLRKSQGIELSSQGGQTKAILAQNSISKPDQSLASNHNLDELIWIHQFESFCYRKLISLKYHLE